MGERVTVTLDIDPVAKKVTLSSSQGGLRNPDTFRVVAEDTLEWTLRGQGASRARVRFVGFPGGSGNTPLLDRGNTFVTSAGSTTSTVSARAFPGAYRYAVDLMGPQGPQPLECFWAPSPGGAPEPCAMGGGEKSGGPRG